MKLYNKTKYPDALLEELLIEAGKSVNARTSNVIVKATSAKAGYNHCHGIAHKCDMVAKWLVSDRRLTKAGDYKSGYVDTEGGYFTITLPYPFLPDWVKNSESYKRGRIPQHDGLNIAELIYSVASHEWQHIKQYQSGFKFDRQERKRNWKNRSWEKDAIKASSKATSKPKNKSQEAILNLALWIEENK